MILGDCLEVMPTLPNGSASMIFADLPYGLVAQQWDKRLNFENLWTVICGVQAKGAVALFTATQPFANALINSRPESFKYDMVWNKGRSSNFFQAKTRPMRIHENVLVFCQGSGTYNPQMTVGPNCAGRMTKTPNSLASHYGSKHKVGVMRGRADNLRYPVSIINAPHNRKYIHPTQKPVALLDWIIRTYSNGGDMVLDPTAGSFTTCVAAASCGRSSVGIEKDEGYFEAGVERMRKHVRDNLLDVKIEVRR